MRLCDLLLCTSDKTNIDWPSQRILQLDKDRNLLHLRQAKLFLGRRSDNADLLLLRMPTACTAFVITC